MAAGVNCLGFLSCAVAVLAITPGCSKPTRTEVLETARQYVSHRWYATNANRFHGLDPDGVPIDTPDDTFVANGWTAGQPANTGIPYQWGGFTKPKKFDRRVARGRPAGHVTRDVDWSNPPRHSRYPVGIDCSGLVSRCWDLRKRYSTKRLPRLCAALGSYDDLLPGDILVKPGRHVVLFKEFSNRQRAHIRVYEANVGRGRCVEATYSVRRLRERGFLPMRYKRLRGD